MPRARLIQTSFTGGELDPKLYGRVDLETYFRGAARLENVLILPQGGVRRRPGLAYVDTTTGSASARLVPFTYQDEQSYLLVFTAGEMKVYKDDELQATVSSAPVSGITAAMLPNLNWAQNDSELILVHEDLQPIKITRSSHTSWSASAISFANIPTYDFGSGAEAVISASRGWPKSVSFFDGRLVLGGLKSRPQTLLMSKVGSPFNLDEGTGLDDEAINITIDDDRANSIRNVFPGRNLQVFTSGGEFYIRGDGNDVITPATVTAARATFYGSAAVRPLSVDGATLFLEENGKVVREFLYSDLEQAYAADDISLLSGHLLATPVEMGLRRSTAVDSANYVFLVNGDGTLAVLNTLRAQDLRAWSRISTSGTFENIAVVAGSVYVVVKRTINGAEVRFIEKFDEDAYLDASLSQTADPATTAWSGLDHLSGETVKVRGDGFVLADAAVSSGNLTSSQAVESLEAGLDFAFTVTTIPVDLQLGSKVMSGEYKRLVAANLRLESSREVVVRAGRGTYRPPFLGFGSEVLDQPAAPFSGWKKISLGGYDRDGQLTITQDAPTAFHLMALTIEIAI